MKQTRNITSILIFLLLIYTISTTGFFLWYRKGYEVAAFLPIVAPVCSYFILRIFRNDTLKIDFKNISWKALYRGALLPLVYMSACVLIYLCIGGKIMTDKFTLPLFLQLFVQWTFAGFCEEIGWRGYLLPMLKKITGKWWAYMICGIIWMSWHLPMIFQNMILTGVSRFAAIILLCLECILVTIILDRLMILNRMSVWTCVAFHAAHNILIQLILAMIPQKSFIWLDDGGILTMMALALSAIVISLYQRKQVQEENSHL